MVFGGSMKRKIAAYSFIVLILLTILAGCGGASVIDSKIRSAESNSSRADEAVEWLIVNGDIVVPELVNRISNSGGRKAKQAARVLILMGDYGRQGMLERFDTMTIEGRDRLCKILAEQSDKQAVLELLALSQHIDAFDMAVSAIISMGDVAMNYLAGQLHGKYYMQAVDSSLVGFGINAIDVIIPSVHSTNQDKVNRALAILSAMGEDAVVKLAHEALYNSDTITDAKRIAGMMLNNYPESAITAVLSDINDDTRPEIAAALLYEISGSENIGFVLMQSSLGNSQIMPKIMQEYMKLCGVNEVLMLALTGDENMPAGAKYALTSGEYDMLTFTAILNNIGQADGMSSKIYSLSNDLLSDDYLKTLALSIIAMDTNAFMQVVSSDMKTEKIGNVLSQGSRNSVVVSRLTAMADTLQGEDKKRIFKVFACAGDDYLPAIVLNAYAQGGDNSIIAEQALIETPVSSGKFKFNNLDMMPYAAKIIEGLTSSNDEEKFITQRILSRISTAKIQNDFYKTIFAYKKEKTIFSVLASHYTGLGALPVNLSFEDGENIIQPTTISVKFTGDVKNVTKSDEPDFSSLLKGFASYLGVSLVTQDADVALEFDCDITPRSTRYSGLLSRSFSGAEASGRLDAYVNGTKIKSVTGFASIIPPQEYPGPSGEFSYKNDEKDAPSDEAYVICFMNAMYNMWGEEAILALYNYNMFLAAQAAEGLLIQ